MNKTYKLNNGLTLTIVNDNKFKTASVSINFISKLCEETYSINALLPYVLKRGCASYPDTLELNRYLDELYASKISCNITKSGDNQIISLTGVTVSDFYADNNQPFINLIKVMHSIIYTPHLPKGKFDESYVNREKENMILFIDGIKNEKREYARKRLIEEMFDDSPYKLYAYGSSEAIRKISNDDLVSYYNNNFKQSLASIVVAGAVNEEEILDTITNLFGAVIIKPEISPVSSQSKNKDTKMVTEPTDVTQSKLAIGYKTEITRNHPLYFGMLLFDNLFGGSVHSKLFLNVREKLSLAYYAASKYNSFKGFLLVDSGIETANYEKAKSEIEKQLEEMKKGNFTDRDIEYTKLAVINSYKSAKDSLSSLLNYYSSSVLVDDFTDIDEAINKVSRTTKSEIVSAANSVFTDTVYLLKGRD